MAREVRRRIGVMAALLGAALLAGCASQTPAANTMSPPHSDAQTREAQDQSDQRDSSYTKMPPLAAGQAQGQGAQAQGANGSAAREPGAQDTSAAATGSKAGAGSDAAAGTGAGDSAGTSSRRTLSLDLGAPDHERHGSLSGHRHRPAALPGSNDSGRLRAQQIAKIIRRQRRLFQRCYEARLKTKEPLPSGGLGLELEIDSSGTVIRAKTGGGTGADKKLSQCLTKVLLAMKFPPPEHGGNVVIRYPIH